MKTSLSIVIQALIKIVVVVDNNIFTARGNIKCRAGPFPLFQADSSGLIRTHENEDFFNRCMYKTSFSLRKSCVYKGILNLRIF